MKYLKYRNGSNDGWLIDLKCGVTKEILDNGEIWYWVDTESFGSLREAKNFMK